MEKQEEMIAAIESFFNRVPKDVIENAMIESIGKEIRTLSDNDESFENIVFELGCSALSKYLFRVMK